MSTTSLHSMPGERLSDRPSLMDRWRAIETPAMWFVLMNCLDAAMTYIVLNSHRPLDDGWKISGTESNQIAGYFLDRWGIKGLFGFKLASAVFVCAIAFIISLKSVSTARRLLAFGTVVLLGVVIYGLFLARFLIHGVSVWPFG